MADIKKYVFEMRTSEDQEFIKKMERFLLMTENEIMELKIGNIQQLIDDHGFEKAVEIAKDWDSRSRIIFGLKR